MSEALTYLIKARPDALKPYFSFLKQAGSRLDAKTRNLISVITKVDVQTEKGFRQYMVRALREGATPHEVLDALLMAFPTLGLAKIIWAVDIILDMDIPEFRPELLDAEAEWHDVCGVDELPHGEITYLQCESRNLYIYVDDAGIRVYDSRCPHQVTDIPHLALEGTTLTCPKHQWEFDMISGECIKKGRRPLKCLETQIVNSRLRVFW